MRQHQRHAGPPAWPTLPPPTPRWAFMAYELIGIVAIAVAVAFASPLAYQFFSFMGHIL